MIIVVTHISLSCRVDSHGAAQEHLYPMFYDSPTGAFTEFLLYFSLVKSFISLIATRVSVETQLKNMFFPDMAKILFGFYTLVSLFVKIFCVVIWFAPGLGVFGFSIPGCMSRQNYSEWAEKCNVTVVSHWEQVTQGYEKEANVNPNWYFTLYILAFLPSISVLLYALKMYFFKSFQGGDWWKIPRKLLHITNCVVFPSITQDWDEDFSTMNSNSR